MKRVPAGWSRLLHPPKWVLVSVPPVVFAALLFVMTSGRNRGIPAYLLYVLSAYCLTIWLLPLPGLARSAKAAVVRRVKRTAFGGRYMNDLAFRGSVGLCLGTAANLLYVALRAAVGIRRASVWNVSVAVYYLALGALRLSLILRYRQRDEIDERRVYRQTAWRLLLLTVPMGGMIVQMAATSAGYSYPGCVIYLSAMYTFYAAIEAVVNLVRFRRLGSPILSAAKALSFVAALMSVLGLQTAMIAQFSAGNEGFRKTMNAITGGAVWLCVILTAVCMLRRCAGRKDEVRTPESIRE